MQALLFFSFQVGLTKKSGAGTPSRSHWHLSFSCGGTAWLSSLQGSVSTAAPPPAMTGTDFTEGTPFFVLHMALCIPVFLCPLFFPLQAIL